MEEINIRRSVRKYQDRTVEGAALDAIFRAAMQAPSAGNQRPWEFYVIEDKEMLANISKVSPYASSIKNAPMAIIMLCNTDRLRFPENWEQDMSTASQNLMLEAVAQGLGSVWLGIAPLEDRMAALCRVLSLPDKYKPFSIIGIGYPLKEDANRFVDRYEADRIYHYGTEEIL